MKTIPNRVLNKINKNGPNGCWLWKGALSGGYGRTWFEGRLWCTHRLIYEILKDKVSTGLELDHLCRNPQCCNPDHLQPVTRHINIIRGNGPQATKDRAALITHCPVGHVYDDSNTYTYKRSRRCKKCAKERCHQWDIAHREQRRIAARNRRKQKKCGRTWGSMEELK